jgi:hypothetical protein
MPAKVLIPIIIVQLSMVKKPNFTKDPAMHKAIERHDLCLYHGHKHEIEAFKCAQAFQAVREKRSEHNIWAEWRRAKTVHEARRREQ